MFLLCVVTMLKSLSFGPPKYSCAMLCKSVLPMLIVGVQVFVFPVLSANNCLYHLPRLSRSVENRNVL